MIPILKPYTHIYRPVSHIYLRNLSSITKFDTRKFVQTLQEKGGFSEKQAEAAVNVVNAAINDGIYSITNNLVKRSIIIHCLSTKGGFCEIKRRTTNYG